MDWHQCVDCTQRAILQLRKCPREVVIKRVETLRELCEHTGVSRRAIQGYEKAGLMSAAARNERGYLLYDAKAQDRVRMIKLLQNLEFSIREIAELDNRSKDEVRREVDAHILRLRQRKVEIDEYIDQAYELIEKIS